MSKDVYKPYLSLHTADKEPISAEDVTFPDFPRIEVACVYNPVTDTWLELELPDDVVNNVEVV